MSNIDTLVFKRAPSIATFSTQVEEEKQPQPVEESKQAVVEPEIEEETVRYRGKQCSKRDIEDFMTKLEARKPVEPADDDCCGDGCNPCVFDTYDMKMERYED